MGTTLGGGFTSGVIMECAFMLVSLAEGRRVGMRTFKKSTASRLYPPYSYARNAVGGRPFQSNRGFISMSYRVYTSPIAKIKNQHPNAMRKLDKEKNHMFQLSFSNEEKAACIELLENALSDLRMEIADTDNSEFKKGLREKKELLSQILDTLKKAVDEE